ncbi:tripartite tricarboxylate transporter substrate binding protein [Siccirubricoccus sp. KC 17139]|uniref:Tripartite tricarboxylate transporter substrate binding protein n=1 Tax=Siccirubricoccus soli TaxID=2899147 RepID=A0ABT1DAR9_9PROT|nr:tripartite tricarboxylate transporter substrate binding protein [Siccirubricoccus soli]MCO6419038.1 tripartite tricarboxylate transporter substrate binding protein [Siccirubricoccus soli]MCP2685173.1 tripartite tricarboxylate transporter substrate binding protein [Siccirubricoccus soli]
MKQGAGAPTRRAVLGLTAGALAAPALAQARFPDRPLRLFVPWTAGSSSDVQMRSLAELAQATLGQPVVVENRPGASGTLHVQPLAASRPDGYTLGQMHLSIVRRPFLVRTPPWDAVADFTHILRLCGWMYGVAVKADSPWQDWRSFIAHAKANPGKLTFATSGIATTNHLAMEELGVREGVEFTHVPYRGSSEGMTAVLSGAVDCIADSSVWVPQVESGAMRALCVWTAERVPRLPGVPTLKELGHDMVVTSPYGISGPKGMDPGVVRALHDAFKAALFSPANTAVRAQFDMPEQYLDSEAYAGFIAQRAEYEKTMVQRLGIRLD